MKKVGLAIIVLSALSIMAFNDVLKSSNTDFKEEFFEAGIYEPIVVLELFTSQGCSSCPAADVLLEKKKKEFPKGVYALSYHVDYWNYIGWEDPFSKSAYSKKQREYNRKFRNRSNYTPQVVINGKEHFVGSSKAKMVVGIEKYKKEKALNNVILKDVKIDNGSVSFGYEVEGQRADKNLRALLVLDERTTTVKRGENRNRTLKNSNIVVAEKTSSIGSENQFISLAIPEIVDSMEKISLIILVEDNEYNITAAAKKTIVRI